MVGWFLTVVVALQAVSPSVPFIHDDYPRALAESRRLHRPLFVDAWAPWCHSCLSMQAYVFTDPSLHAYADRFVWLSLDTERPENATFLERYPVDSWPTLFVLDPELVQPRARWVEMLTTPELTRRLERLASEQPAAPDTVRGLIRRAHNEDDGGRRAEAVALLREAIVLPASEEEHGEAVAALVTLLQTYDDHDCATLAFREAPRLHDRALQANLVSTGLTCALTRHLPDPALLQTGMGLLKALLDDPHSPLLADDQSSLYGLWLEVCRARGEGDRAREVAERWAAFLDVVSSAATTPASRAVFDAHRVQAYAASGVPERALPMLEQSERDFPGDYNPPARRADVLLKLGRFQEALAAARHARSLVYGPRTLRVLLTEAQALHGLGRWREAQHTLQEAERLVARLPAGQRQPSQWQELDAARHRLGP